MDEIALLDSDTRGDFTYYDASSVRFFAVNTNYNAFESLETEFVTFFDFLSDTNSVAGANIDYVAVRDRTDDARPIYVMANARLPHIFKKEDQYEIVAEFKGSALKGVEYEPIFPYFASSFLMNGICVSLSLAFPGSTS